MAFDINGARSYGTGSLGDVTNPTNINSYAKVTAHASKTITISGDDLSAFTAGTEILIHVSGIKTSSVKKSLGLYQFAKIMSVEGNVLTLSVTPLDVNTSNYYVQAITVPHYKKLTLSNTISPPAFDTEKGCGGILVFKCSSRLTMSGKIDLTDKGLPEDSQRPLLNQEQDGTGLDTLTYAGYENYDCSKHFTLQKGDGACLIIAKRIDFSDSARIGNPNLHGVQRCRGASDSYDLPTGVTNIGGSSILIVAPTINDFDAKIIAKYRSKTLEAGKGLCRAYIATESGLPCDEGLYSYDIINTPDRLSKETCINSFGNGADGVAKSPTKQQNSYARVLKISDDGKTFTLTNIDSGGVAKFKRGSLIMIQANYKAKHAHDGRFIVSECVGILNDINGNLTSITLKNSINDLGLGNFTTTNYNFQAIAIPQYTSFTLSGSNGATIKYENGRGGIFAIAVNGTCDLTHGGIFVEDKGGATYSASSVSNARMKNRLPIGQGHGSVFILAKSLKVESNTDLGANHDGNRFGGYSIYGSPTSGTDGGYKGRRRPDSVYYASKYDGYAGSGAKGGTQHFNHNGGWFSNASDLITNGLGGRQGVSIFIVAQSIDGLCLGCLTTGGEGGGVLHEKELGGGSLISTVRYPAARGGCGYGGGSPSVEKLKRAIGAGGGVVGGGGGGSDEKDGAYVTGGGSSGFCCIYCNTFTNQDTENMTFD